MIIIHIFRTLRKSLIIKAVQFMMLVKLKEFYQHLMKLTVIFGLIAIIEILI